MTLRTARCAAQLIITSPGASSVTDGTTGLAAERSSIVWLLAKRLAFAADERKTPPRKVKLSPGRICTQHGQPEA